MPNQYEKLLQRLDLTQEEPAIFLGGSGVGGVTADNRLYGGLVAAQAAVAAARTVDESLYLHSMHAYFLRPGRPDSPIRFAVDAIKRGRNFHTRQVQATQGKDVVFQMLASFSRYQDGVEHQDTMIAAPEPEGLPNRDQARGRGNWQDPHTRGAIDVRLCDPLTDKTPLAATKSVWLKPFESVPEDPIVHLALLVFASDRAFLSTAWRPHADQGNLQGASLDHSLWLHDRVNFNDWHLYQMHSPAARFQRGLVQGAIYRRDGHRIATVVQEGVLTAR